MDEEQQAAAIKLQAIKRGKDSRDGVRAQKEERQAAAQKLQAIKRGKDSRESVRARREAEAQALADEQAAKEAAAQAKLGAGAKGYVARKQRQKENVMSARLQANYRGHKERDDPQSTTNVRKARSKNDPGHQADMYMQQHKLVELFELLGQKLVAARPEDAREFLIQELTKLKKTPVPSSPLNFFSQEDMDTLFSMYDASGDGLTQGQCREALNAMGLESVKVPYKERFDRAAFFSLMPAGL